MCVKSCICGFLNSLFKEFQKLTLFSKLDKIVSEMLQTLKFYFSFKLVFKTFNSRIVDKNLKTFLILKKKKKTHKCKSVFWQTKMYIKLAGN